MNILTQAEIMILLGCPLSLFVRVPLPTFCQGSPYLFLSGCLYPLEFVRVPLPTFCQGSPTHLILSGCPLPLILSGCLYKHFVRVPLPTGNYSVTKDGLPVQTQLVPLPPQVTRPSKQYNPSNRSDPGVELTWPEQRCHPGARLPCLSPPTSWPDHLPSSQGGASGEWRG